MGAFIALVAATSQIPSTTGGRFRLDLFVGLFAACLLVAASHEGLLQRILSWKPLVWIGTFAYSLYLIHFPIIQIVWQYVIEPCHLPSSVSLGLHWLLGIPLSVGIAYLFHVVFERPFMSKPGKPAPKTERQAELAAVESPAP